MGEESVELFREIGEKWGLALGLDFLGLLAAARGEQEQAGALHAESLALYRGASGQPRSGMGVDAADVFGSGYQDLFVANVDQEMFSLYRNLKNESFRDEAHRTAVAYHRSLREKRALRSPLDDIPGVGPTRKKALLKRFGSLTAIRRKLLPCTLGIP